MRCRRARKLIYLLLEDDLKQQEREDLLDHLGICQQCSLEWKEAKELHLFWKTSVHQEMLPQLSEQELPQRVEMRIEQLRGEIKERTVREKVFSFLVVHRKLAYGAAAVVLVFLSLWLGILPKGGKEVPRDVVVHSAFIDEKKAEFSISESEDKDIVLIWLETS